MRMIWGRWVGERGRGYGGWNGECAWGVRRQGVL